MKYKNIIFDFGNVIGKFKGDYILGKFASTPEDYNILADAIFKNWAALDAGTIDYDQNAEDTIAELPDLTYFINRNVLCGQIHQNRHKKINKYNPKNDDSDI